MALNLILLLVVCLLSSKLWNARKEKLATTNIEKLLEIENNRLIILREGLEGNINKYNTFVANSEFLKKRHQQDKASGKNQESVNETLLAKVNNMEKVFISLQEKYRHEPKMLIACIKDFEHFIDYCFDVKSEHSASEHDFEDGSTDRLEEAVQELKLRIEQIERRFENLLSRNT